MDRGPPTLPRDSSRLSCLFAQKGIGCLILAESLGWWRGRGCVPDTAYPPGMCPSPGLSDSANFYLLILEHISLCWLFQEDPGILS